ncbi:MAG: endonuclease/exonuclease/phosphatase family protein [Bacteroidota bacterium]
MKLLKRIFRILLIIIGLAVLYVGGMIAYAMITDYEPELTTEAKIESTASQSSLRQDTLRLLNWNIGYCGLGEESDFFYDGGETVRMPREIVEKNLEGVKRVLEDYVPDYDFILLQEVEKDSRRSYHINQYEVLKDLFRGYAASFGKNYHVAFIPIPFTNPMGGVHSGLATYTRYQPQKSTRFSFEGNYDWPNYLFFLDRCFLVNRYPLENGKELILINTHNSAYDDGTLRQRQMEQLSDVLIEEYQKGNYVLVGGDWNQKAPGFTGFTDIPSAEGGIPIAATYPEEGWTWAFDPDIPTNRQLIKPYDPATTTRTLIDFYLLSPNIELVEVKTRDLGFAYSDHQPVELSVKLSGLHPEPDSVLSIE